MNLDHLQRVLLAAVSHPTHRYTFTLTRVSDYNLMIYKRFSVTSAAEGPKMSRNFRSTKGYKNL